MVSNFQGNYQGLCSSAKHPPQTFDSLTTTLVGFIYQSMYLYQVLEWLLTVYLQISINTPSGVHFIMSDSTDSSHMPVNTHRLCTYKYELRTRPTKLTSHKSAYLWSHKNVAKKFACGVLCGDHRYAREETACACPTTSNFWPVRSIDAPILMVTLSLFVNFSVVDTY